MTTLFQQKCVLAILNSRNQQATLTEISARVKSNRVAVHSALRALERRKLAGYIRSDDSQWAVQIWFLKERAQPEQGEK